jgi:hypothetical protein
MPAAERADFEMSMTRSPELIKFYQETLLSLELLNHINDSPENTTIKILNEESRSGSLEMH